MCQFTGITVTRLKVSVNVAEFFSVYIYQNFVRKGTFPSGRKKQQPVRRTAVRETGVSRHPRLPIGGPLKTPSIPQQFIVLRGLIMGRLN